MLWHGKDGRNIETLRKAADNKTRPPQISQCDHFEQKGPGLSSLHPQK